MHQQTDKEGSGSQHAFVITLQLPGVLGLFPVLTALVCF
jgi:hypothetical protein